MPTKIIALICFVSLYMNSAAAQEITSFTGLWSVEYYEDDNRITMKELEALFEKNQEVKAYWKKSETNAILGYSALAAELGCAAWFGINFVNDKSLVGPLVGTLGFGTLAGVFLSLANKNAKKAILLYNKQFDNTTSFRLSPISNECGMGLAIKF